MPFGILHRAAPCRNVPVTFTLDRMFPIPSRARQLEIEWAAELAQHLRCPEADFRGAPTRHMRFPIQTLRLELVDGSFAEFRYAFALVSEERKAIAVFTEHCGHHLFPYHDARILVDGEITYEQHAA